MKPGETGSPPDPSASRPATALSPAELAERIAALGGEPFRARQVEGSLFKGKALSWEEVKGLPGPLKEKLAASFPLVSSRMKAVVQSPDGTRKMALLLADGVTVEAALIPSGKRRTLCLSTQAGCPVGCRFCASGIGGLLRNLEAYEILEQAFFAQHLLPPGEKVTHLVVMGVGEPLFNLESLLQALDVLGSPASLGIGARRVVVSTSGVPQGMRALSRRRPPLNLAVSLHTADQELREDLVPMAQRWTVGEILAEAGRYQESTGRRVTLEVVLLDGLTDTPRQARLLARAAAPRGFHVNLLAWNPVPDLPFRPSPPSRVKAFAGLLEKNGVNVTIRRSRGAGASAACGQLRRLGSPGLEEGATP